MATKICKACSKEISDTAGRCPHCGARHDYGGYAWTLVVVIILAVMVATCTGRAGEYYTWTDEDGVVHMSNTPVAEPAKKAPIKKHAYEEASPAARDQAKREQDYKYKRSGAQDDYQRRIDEIREDSAKRDREYNAQRCTDARS